VTLMNAAAIQMEAAAVLMTAPIVPPGLAPPADALSEFVVGVRRAPR
jgi:hypothetical protein